MDLCKRLHMLEWFVVVNDNVPANDFEICIHGEEWK